jgi:hypothetical protein
LFILHSNRKVLRESRVKKRAHPRRGGCAQEKTRTATKRVQYIILKRKRGTLYGFPSSV